MKSVLNRPFWCKEIEALKVIINTSNTMYSLLKCYKPQDVANSNEKVLGIKLEISPFDTDFPYYPRYCFWHICFRRCNKFFVIGKTFSKETEGCIWREICRSFSLRVFFTNRKIHFKKLWILPSIDSKQHYILIF